MSTSKRWFLQSSLLVLFISFPLSWAHNKSHEKVVSVPPPSQPTVNYKSCFSKVYAFGDSSTDNGNSYMLGNLQFFSSGSVSSSHSKSFKGSGGGGGGNDGSSYSKSFRSSFGGGGGRGGQWSYSKSSHGSGGYELSGHRLTNGRLVVDYLTQGLGVATVTPYKSLSKEFSGYGGGSGSGGGGGGGKNEWSASNSIHGSIGGGGGGGARGNGGGYGSGGVGGGHSSGDRRLTFLPFYEAINDGVGGNGGGAGSGYGSVNGGVDKSWSFSNSYQGSVGGGGGGSGGGGGGGAGGNGGSAGSNGDNGSSFFKSFQGSNGGGGGGGGGDGSIRGGNNNGGGSGNNNGGGGGKKGGGKKSGDNGWSVSNSFKGSIRGGGGGTVGSSGDNNGAGRKYSSSGGSGGGGSSGGGGGTGGGGSNGGGAGGGGSSGGGGGGGTGGGGSNGGGAGGGGSNGGGGGGGSGGRGSAGSGGSSGAAGSVNAGGGSSGGSGGANGSGKNGRSSSKSFHGSVGGGGGGAGGGGAGGGHNSDDRHLTFFKSVYNSIDDGGGGGGSVGADGGGRTSAGAGAGGYASGGRSSEIDGSVNFAIAGATSLSKDYFVHKKVGHSFLWGKTPVTYETQIDWFNNVYAEKSRRKGERACRADMANTLFWIGGIGSSDYSRMYGSSIKSQYLNKLSVIHACKILKALINNGAKYIMVQGLPPMGCLPSQLSRCSPSDRDKSGCSAKANAVIIAHNTLLQQKLEHFRHKYPDRIISYVDTYGAYQTILANYKSYHFEEPFKACCGAHDSSSGYDFDVNRVCGSSGSSTCQDPSKHISWDGIHFTGAMNAQLADLFLNKGYCQPSFQDILKAKKCQ